MMALTPMQRLSGMASLISRALILGILSIQIYRGIEDYLLYTPEYLASNAAYVNISAYQPLYTIILPLVWLLYVAVSAFKYYDKTKLKNIFNSMEYTL